MGVSPLTSLAKQYKASSYPEWLQMRMNGKAQEKHKRSAEGPSNCKAKPGCLPPDYTHSHLSNRDVKWISTCWDENCQSHISRTTLETGIVSIPKFLFKRNSKAFQVEAVQTQGHTDSYLSYSEHISPAVMNFTIISWFQMIQNNRRVWYIHFDICIHISILSLYYKIHKTVHKLRSVILILPNGSCLLCNDNFEWGHKHY